jgi:glycosyltransferase involved in cell wall biosynthesis
MKKIGISCNKLAHSGGFERYARDLVRGMSALDIRPALFAKEFDKSLPEYFQVDPVHLAVNFVPSKFRDALFSWRLNRSTHRQGLDRLFACNRVAGADVAICGGTHLGYLAAIGKTPSWSDERQIKLERKHYESAKTIVAHSQLMAQELQKYYGLPSSRIKTLYPPVDLNAFTRPLTVDRQRMREKLGFESHTCVFFFASTSHERKGFPLLEQFFLNTQLPVTLVVAGRPVNNSSNIRYLGYVKNMAECYAAADYTILASQYEPFGLVALESVLCGTPLCLAEGVGAGEVISPTAKVVFQRDKDNLAAAIETALNEKDIRRKSLEETSPLISSYNASIEAHVKQLLEL